MWFMSIPGSHIDDCPRLYRGEGGGGEPGNRGWSTNAGNSSPVMPLPSSAPLIPVQVCEDGGVDEH